jgi:YfiH family protein
MAIPERAEASARPDDSSPPPLHGPLWRGDHPVWSASVGPVEVRFVGRGLGGTRAAILRRVEGREIPVAEAKQVHSDGVLAVGPRGVPGGDDLHDEQGGERSGKVEGDALWTDVPGIALSVITADCVPVLLAERGGDRIAAVHAGWRGLVAGVIPRAIEALGAPPGSLDAWIGPAIGICCYEVGEDVAAAVVGASAPRVMRETPGRPHVRPHLDLAAAARHQLERAGVEAIRGVDACTHCDPERLWSYRREGPGGGRNVAYVWRRDPETPSAGG